MGLTAATHLAEKITDEVVDLLNKTQTCLVMIYYLFIFKNTLNL